MSTTEKTVTHSPGPWRLAFDADGDHAIFDRDDILIAITTGIPGVPLGIDKANARIFTASLDLLKALEELECPECGHALTRHADRYGCESELGDREGYEGAPAQAMGPCGCECLDVPDLLTCIAAIRKARGEGL